MGSRRERTGLGEALVRPVGKMIVERYCGRFEWTVRDWKEPATRFYEDGSAILKEWCVVRTIGDAPGAAGCAD